MSTQSATVGRCPHCEVDIPQIRVLIEYETATGSAAYAECPNCRDVIQPA